MFMKRCKWCNIKNKVYVDYHDNEWGVLNLEEKYLLEMLILESFQSGLSWECILNKREAFKKAYDNFDIEKILKYDLNKINELINNKDIIKNKLKIKYSIENTKIFKSISLKYNGFGNYLLSFFKKYPIYETGKVTSNISDLISKDLKSKGMKYVGSKVIYSYLQAIGLINSHENGCFKQKIMLLSLWKW